MEQEHHLAFGSFRLDMTHGCLWQGEHSLALRPRTLAMLCYLAEHPGRLVTKAELRLHVWAGTHVTDTVLRVWCVRRLCPRIGTIYVAKQKESIGRWCGNSSLPWLMRPYAAPGTGGSSR
jgi:hypothetical protein